MWKEDMMGSGVRSPRPNGCSMTSFVTVSQETLMSEPMLHCLLNEKNDQSIAGWSSLVPSRANTQQHTEGPKLVQNAIHSLTNLLKGSPICWGWGKVWPGWASRLSSVRFSCSVKSNSLWPHEPQHARPPCPSPSPRVYPNSCPLSW